MALTLKGANLHLNVKCADCEVSDILALNPAEWAGREVEYADAAAKLLRMYLNDHGVLITDQKLADMRDWVLASISNP